MADDPEWIEELFAGFGPVRLKRMFSGYGIYSGEFCIALAIDPGLCFRCGEESRAALEAVGAEPFVYTKKTGVVTVNAWWQVPDSLVDEPDAIARLARLSLAVARTLPPKKKRVKKVGKVPARSAAKAPAKKPAARPKRGT